MEAKQKSITWIAGRVHIHSQRHTQNIRTATKRATRGDHLIP